MERIGGEDEGQTGSIRQVALASFIGTAIEWYDFFLYGTAAALVFGGLFFPEATPLQGTFLAFATYGVGFFARPVGGIIFGHYGDRIGRKTMLVLSLLIMGVATFLIGLLPTFEQVGVLAPLLLVVLRLLQGVGVGGEWGGAVLMAVEHAPPGRRGFFGSWPQMGVPAGLLLANVVFAITSATLPEAWGWRVPFLFSIVLVGVGLFIRLRIMETPAFDAGQGERHRGADAYTRRAPHLPQERPAGDGHAHRRERHLLHPDRLRAHLRRARSSVWSRARVSPASSSPPRSGC